MNDLLAALQDALEADPILAAYNETVEVQDYDPANLPVFSKHAIIISPKTRSSAMIAAREWQHAVAVDIVVLRLRFNEEDAALNADGSVPETTGILKGISNVWSCLNNNDLNGTVQRFGDELAESVPVKEIKGGYYYEAVIAGKFRLAATTL